MGTEMVQAPFPFFKETEINAKCCGCNQNLPAAESPQIMASNPNDFNTMSSTSYVHTGTHFLKEEKGAQVKMFNNPVPLGTPQLTNTHYPQTPEFGSAKTSLNIDRVIKDN
jgi:hypothetical protein